MKPTTTSLSTLLAAFALAGCSSVTVTTDFDHSATFGKYKSYTLAPPAQTVSLSVSTQAALRDTLRTELGARGIAEAKGKGDIAIVPHVFTKDKVSVQQYTDWGYGSHGAWPYGYGSYGMWSHAPRTYVDVNTYTEGTLILDVVDTRTQKLVFRGTGTALVGSEQSNANKVRDAVKKMVEAVPRGAAH